MSCPNCQGRGEVVRVFIAYDANGKEIVHHQAVPCSGCAGTGEV